MEFEIEIQFPDTEAMEGVATPTADDIHDWVLNGCKRLGVEPVLLVVNPS